MMDIYGYKRKSLEFLRFLSISIVAANSLEKNYSKFETIVLRGQKKKIRKNDN